MCHRRDLSLSAAEVSLTGFLHFLTRFWAKTGFLGFGPSLSERETDAALSGVILVLELCHLRVSE